MKKVISILLVLCVAASLFAAVTVKAGFDFGTVSTKSLEDKVAGAKDITFKTHGVGFDVAVMGDVAPNLAVYGDVSGVFPIFFKESRNGGAEYTIHKGTDTDTETDFYFDGFKASSVAFRSGVLYKMNVQGVDLGLGGGLVFSTSKAKFGDKDFNDYYRVLSRNFGLSLYATGTYAVAKNVGINLTINPDIYLYNYAASYNNYDSDTEVCKFEAYGFRAGFAFNASLGVAFSF